MQYRILHSECSDLGTGERHFFAQSLSLERKKENLGLSYKFCFVLQENASLS